MLARRNDGIEEHRDDFTAAGLDCEFMGETTFLSAPSRPTLSRRSRKITDATF